LPPSIFLTTFGEDPALPPADITTKADASQNKNGRPHPFCEKAHFRIPSAWFKPGLGWLIFTINESMRHNNDGYTDCPWCIYGSEASSRLVNWAWHISVQSFTAMYNYFLSQDLLQPLSDCTHHARRCSEALTASSIRNCVKNLHDAVAPCTKK
jgi:hypothetical protein